MKVGQTISGMQREPPLEVDDEIVLTNDAATYTLKVIQVKELEVRYRVVAIEEK